MKTLISALAALLILPACTVINGRSVSAFGTYYTQPTQYHATTKRYYSQPRQVPLIQPYQYQPQRYTPAPQPYRYPTAPPLYYNQTSQRYTTSPQPYWR